ncbi:thioredoxin family protein, partial [Salinisphaera sp. SWV1]|uniref:thioredoxin family protein n=1 Tax=Salinisphaera sp. SWV1 TaxID=3454139 RepID=UPI003F849C18
LAGLATPPASDAGRAGAKSAVFDRVTTAAGLSHALAAARRAGRPAMVDFYADWCVDCARMKRTVFADARVRRALSRVTAIEFDVTAYDTRQQRLMQRLNVFGPPTLLFYPASAENERPRQRLVGAVDAATVLHALDKIAAKPGT